MALLYTKKDDCRLKIGSQAPDFELRGIDDKRYTLKDFSSSPVVVILFTCNHCPYAQATEERLIQIQKDYGPKGVQLVAINPNDGQAYPEDNFENMIRHAREQGWNFPYLHDATQAVAKAYDAVCTPECYVFDRERVLHYHGRVDDNLDYRHPKRPTSHDLRRTLDELLAGKAVSQPVVPSMGCSIKWRW